MERLTQRMAGGILLRKELDICVETPEDFYNLQHVLSIIADYEDLGVTPDQIQEIDKLYLEKCEEVNRLKEKQTPKEPRDKQSIPDVELIGICQACGRPVIDAFEHCPYETPCGFCSKFDKPCTEHSCKKPIKRSPNKPDIRSEMTKGANAIEE